MKLFQNGWTIDLFAENNLSQNDALSNDVGDARPVIRFIDLFAGLGGTRLGFEQACETFGKKPMCVFTSELKEFAIKTYQRNFGEERIHGDITEIPALSLPEFDYMLAGFPCQPLAQQEREKVF